YTYAWSNGLGSGASKTVSLLATTTYTVTITDFNGCTASTTVAVTVEPKAKVGDFVWEDKNANGIQDFNEIGIGNVPVSIYDANSNVLIDQTNTLGNGYYEFNVCKGTYYIVFGEYSNYFRTFADKGSDLSDSDANQTTGRTENFTLNPSDNNTTIDAGYYKLASIGDFVWEDIDANGVQGMLENGVPNVEVSITGILNTTNSMGLPILVPPSIILTGPNGEYLFTNLIPGRYTVVVNKPDGYLFSPKDQDGDDAKDSDSDPVTGVMPEETLESGENNLTYDAGIYPEINLEINKTFVSALVQPNGTYNVTYNVEVINTGGPGKYDLKDTPAFDDDININSSSFTSTANGNA
ncbi:MAG TPA: SdrD B-like domain-containing protein, partial [Saprospiraceae bacterium]|nr:SdrD B-like domain-containing protein [Saprospiraceae bacterium]